jgi:hypothetical protein
MIPVSPRRVADGFGTSGVAFISLALADEALQVWNQAEALLEERVDGQRLAEGGERLARLIL